MFISFPTKCCVVVQVSIFLGATWLRISPQLPVNSAHVPDQEAFRRQRREASQCFVMNRIGRRPVCGVILEYIPNETLVGTLNVSCAHEPSCRVAVVDIFAGRFSICTRCDDSASAGCVFAKRRCILRCVSSYGIRRWGVRFRLRQSFRLNLSVPSASILLGSRFSCFCHSSWLRHRLACHTGDTNVRIARGA